MKTTVIRGGLFAVFFLLFHFALHLAEPVLWAFVITYILESAISQGVK